MTETDKFNGDYDALRTSYTELESKLGSQSSTISEQTTKIAELQAQIQTLQSKPSQSTTDGPPEGQSLYDWHNGKMRTEDGKLDPGLVAAMKRAGADEDVVEALASTVEKSLSIIQSNTEAFISKSFGNQAELDKAIEWATTNLPGPKAQSISRLLGDSTTLEYGLDLLKKETEAGGYKPTTQHTEQTQEPGKIPVSTASGPSGGAPLKPNSPEAMAAQRDPRYKSDRDYFNEVNRRLYEGAKSN